MSTPVTLLYCDRTWEMYDLHVCLGCRGLFNNHSPSSFFFSFSLFIDDTHEISGTLVSEVSWFWINSMWFGFYHKRKFLNLCHVFPWLNFPRPIISYILIPYKIIINLPKLAYNYDINTKLLQEKMCFIHSLKP